MIERWVRVISYTDMVEPCSMQVRRNFYIRFWSGRHFEALWHGGRARSARGTQHWSWPKRTSGSIGVTFGVAP